MRTTRRLLIVTVVLALPLWLAGTAAGGVDCENDKFADHPQCQETPVPPEEPMTLNCQELGWLSPADGSLVISPAAEASCQDVTGVIPGASFDFDFDVGDEGDDGSMVRSFFVLGIRNSVPGDWCRGTWVVFDAGGTVVIEGYGRALRPYEVGDGWHATLTIGDEIASDGNCMSDGEVLWADEDPRFVLSLVDAGGKPLRQAVTVTWSSNT